MSTETASRPTIRGKIVSFVRERAAQGATADEIERALCLPHQTASARVNEAVADGALVKSGESRPTRNGRNAVVLVADGELAPAYALIPIDDIKAIDRHRKSLGDIDALAKSIADVGLLHPVVVTASYRLLAGGRRLEACRRLGWDTVPATVVASIADTALQLQAERDENTCRENMLPSELASLGAALSEIEAQRAKQRMASAGRSAAPGRPAERSGDAAGPFGTGGESREAVGEALGMSARTYHELSFVQKVATDDQRPEDERELAKEALAEMDRTRAVWAHAGRLRTKLAAKQDAEPEPEAEPLPRAADHSQRAAAARRERIRELAAAGHSSRQIADLVGMTYRSVREAAREHGITITADKVLGRTHIGSPRDADRLMTEIVTALEGAAFGASLLRLDEVDVAQARTWATSLTKAVRAINKLAKQLKEIQ